MLPTNFEDANDILYAGDNGDCADLHIARVHTMKSRSAITKERMSTPIDAPVADSYPGVVSFWAFEPGDVTELLRSGGVYLYARGHTHPPISVSAFCPIPGKTKPKRVITAIDHINLETVEGSLLLAAIVKLIRIEGNSSKSTAEVLQELND